jgi:hypothetical protein
MPKKASKQEQKYVEHFAYINKKETARRSTCIAAIKSFLAAVNGEIIIRFKTVKGETPSKKGAKVQTLTVQEQQKADDEKYFRLAREYLEESRDICADFEEWKRVSDKAPKTMRVYLGCVKEFLELNGKVIDPRHYKGVILKFKGGDEAPQDAPKHAKINSFLEHCDVRMKAISLMLSSSGMRIGECIALRKEWIDFDRRMITLPAKVTKTNHGRYVFFSKEAEKALHAWMAEKADYINQVNEYANKFKDGNNKKAVDDGRIFPFDTLTINRAWNKTASRAGMGNVDMHNHLIFHPHAMRAFYSTQMKRAGCPESIVEKLLGHKDKYGGAYDKYDSEDCQEAYEQYAPAILIQGGKDMQKQVETLTLKAEAQNGEMSILKKENEELKKKIAAIENNDEMEKLRKETELHKKLINEIYAKLQSGKLVIPQKTS